MKILISGTAKAVADKEQFVQCYNFIKRNEEDLCRHIPQLKDFTLIIHPNAAVISFNPSNLHCQQKLSTDQSSLTLTLGYRAEPQYSDIIKALERQLKQLRNSYD